MSKIILEKIVKEIETAKYFSIIVDSIPDLSKIDQLMVDLLNVFWIFTIYRP